MADKNIEIGIKTTVDTTGAVAAGKAVGKLADETKRLGDTAGRKGNAAQAILEVSRGLEDLQYGIRGVLNNIPSLVFALGGGAGLAGVISIAAVAGSQLYSFLTKGPKDAEKATDDLLEKYDELRKAFDEIGKLERQGLKEAAQERADALVKSLNGIDRRSKVEIDQGNVNLARIEAEKRVQLSEKALELAKLEAEALLGGNRDANQLAERRLEIAREIEGIEKAAREAARQEKLAQAQGKVEAATGKFEAAKTSDAAAAQALKVAEDAARPLLTEIETLTAARIAKIEMLQKEIADAEQRLQATLKLPPVLLPGGEVAPNVEAQRIASELALLENSLVDAEKVPERLSEITVELNEKQKTVDQQAAALKEAAAQVEAAAKALTDAQLAAGNLRETQFSERGAESREAADRAGIAAINQTRASEGVTVEGINQLVDAIGTGGGADLQKAVQELAKMASDNKLSAEELGRVNLLLAQYGAQMQRFAPQLISTIQGLQSNLDELTRQVNNLKSAAKQAPKGS